MKLQTLIVIFIIIIIPIVLIFSLYLNLETKTIAIQTDYDTKLIEATKEAMEAFEINTVEWNSKYSELANVKRRNINASIEIFTTSLASKLGIGGTSKEAILTYIPAIVYTMYDGYYIYSPTHIPQTITDEKGIQYFYYKDAETENTKHMIFPTQNIKGTKVAGEPMYLYDSSKGGSATGTYENELFTTNIDYAKKTYKHVLKTFIPYTTTYGDYTVNYTLDDYIRVYGEDESEEGYIIDTNKLVFGNNNHVLYYDSTPITPEKLTENIAVKNDSGNIEVNEYAYIYAYIDEVYEKIYYDSSNNKFFRLTGNYSKSYLREVEAGHSDAAYKKLLVKKNDNNYEELYQLLNTSEFNWYYKDGNGQYHLLEKDINNKWYYNNKLINISINQDTSSLNFYAENYYFTKWLKSKFNDNQIEEIKNKKIQSIINNINNNLNLSMSNYSSNSNVNYKMPELTEDEWTQALSNISIISFFQGMKVGLKTYNNYAIVTSTENNEYISSDSLYYLDTDPENNEKYYHRYGCSCLENISIEYKNTEFKVQSYTDNSGTVQYYYKHNKNDIASMPCFDCIINRNNIDFDETHYKIARYAGLARERYIQMQRTKIID